MLGQPAINLEELKTFIESQIQNNDFLVGVLVPVILGGLFYFFKGWATAFYEWLKKVLSAKVTINTDSPIYHDIASWVFSDLTLPLFQRSFTYYGETNNESPFLHRMRAKVSNDNLQIGYGFSLGRWGWRPIFIYREQEKSDSNNFKEIMTIIIPFARRATINIFVSQMKRAVNSDLERIEKFIPIKVCNEYGELERKKWIIKRPIDSVFVPNSIKKQIINGIETFLQSEERYIRMGRSWHLGILLHGEPGTGKTSLIQAIASHFNAMIIYYVLGDELEFAEDFSHSPIFHVIEDIDAAKINTRSREDGNEISSKLLNTLDGVMSPHGYILFATTNHLDTIDPAIVRPGRFDIVIEIGKMEWDEWLEMCRFYGVESPVSKEEYKPILPSEAQYLFINKDFEKIEALFKS